MWPLDTTSYGKVSNQMKKKLLLLAGITTLALATGGGIALASAIDNFAVWTITPEDPAAKDHSGAVDFPAIGFPDGSYTVTRSADDGEDTELLTGATGGDWFTSDTPFAEVFGATGPNEPEKSQIQYLKVRVDDSGFDTKATTTYTFDSPTVAKAFGFALSDIDVDQATITAKDKSGGNVSGADLVGKTFNFCDVAPPLPDECTGGPYGIPTWTPGSNGGVLSGGEDDTEGSTGWFRPKVALKSLTVVFEGVDAGSPSYRTWLAALTNPIRGCVKRRGAPLAGVKVALKNSKGKTLESTKTGSDCKYAFDGYVARDGYKVRVVPPKGNSVVGKGTRAVSNAKGAGVANFKLNKGRPQPVTG